MMSTIPQIVFLLYYSRSGSTLLSSVLDKFPDIGVTLESNFMAKILLEKNRIKRVNSASEIYDRLVTEERFCNLNIKREDFVENFGQKTKYSIEEIVQGILYIYFSREKPECKVWVIKDGANGYLINQIAQEMPKAKFVHLIRDGRAVLNSQLKTTRPYGKGEKMARDPLTVARLWTSLVDSIDHYMVKNPHQCVEIRYEDMVADIDTQINHLRHFFGLRERQTQNYDSNYYTRLPQKEKSIHPLVLSPPIPERISVWEKEIPSAHLLIFQLCAKSHLAKHGYHIDRNISMSKILLDRQFLFTYITSQLLRMRDWGILAIKPKRLKKLINIKMVRWRDKILARSGATSVRSIG